MKTYALIGSTVSRDSKKQQLTKGTNKMKKAAIYARTATEEQRLINRQISKAKKKIAKDGNVLQDECVYIENGVSGSTLNRSGLDKLKQDARDRKFSVLYIQDYTRLSRNVSDAILLARELTDRNIELVFLTKAHDQFVFNIKRSLLQYLHDSRSEEIKRGIKAKREREKLAK